MVHVPWWPGLNDKGKQCYRLLSAKIADGRSGVYMAPTGGYLATFLPAEDKLYRCIHSARRLG
jgi:hypothetical protein